MSSRTGKCLVFVVIPVSNGIGDKEENEGEAKVEH